MKAVNTPGMKGGGRDGEREGGGRVLDAAVFDGAASESLKGWMFLDLDEK